MTPVVYAAGVIFFHLSLLMLTKDHREENAFGDEGRMRIGWR